MWSKLVIASGMTFCDIVLSSLFSMPEKKIVQFKSKSYKQTMKNKGNQIVTVV